MTVGREGLGEEEKAQRGSATPAVERGSATGQLRDGEELKSEVKSISLLPPMTIKIKSVYVYKLGNVS